MAAKSIGAEVVELVDVEVKVAAFGFRKARAFHGDTLKARHQERAQEVRLVLADLALTELGNEHLAGVHDLGKIDRRSPLRRAYYGWRAAVRIAPTLFCRGEAASARKRSLQLAEFELPELPHLRIGDVLHDGGGDIRSSTSIRGTEEEGWPQVVGRVQDRRERVGE